MGGKIQWRDRAEKGRGVPRQVLDSSVKREVLDLRVQETQQRGGNRCP